MEVIWKDYEDNWKTEEENISNLDKQHWKQEERNEEKTTTIW